VKSPIYLSKQLMWGMSGFPLGFSNGDQRLSQTCDANNFHVGKPCYEVFLSGTMSRVKPCFSRDIVRAL
jgi:hypothetical protein